MTWKTSHFLFPEQALHQPFLVDLEGFERRIIIPYFLPRCRLVVVGEVAQEEKGQHVVAKVVRIHRATQLVGDVPEGIAQLFLISVGHL